MKKARTAIFKTLRLLTLASACLASAAFADEYAEVSQLLKANKFAEAMTKVEAFLATKPADPQMRFVKGVIQRNLGKQAEAIATFTKLIEDYPELPEPYNNLAVLYAGQGQYDKARVALEMAIRTNPSYATAHENMGDVYARLASQAYNKALQLDTGNAAVPPKLALIRELFKPNLAFSKQGAVAPVVTAAATPAVAAPVVSAANTSATKPGPVASAVKPATPVASAVVSAIKPAPATVEANASKDAADAVQSWAQAWSDKNMSAYLKAYGPQFTPPGKQSRNVWEKERRDRIMGKSNISVKLSDLKIEVSGDKAVARFHQTYKADSLLVASRKTLDLQKVSGLWLITRESTGN